MERGRHHVRDDGAPCTPIPHLASVGSPQPDASQPACEHVTMGEEMFSAPTRHAGQKSCSALFFIHSEREHHATHADTRMYKKSNLQRER